MSNIHLHNTEYIDLISASKTIKAAIVESRYRCAKLVNREILTLYYNIGRYVSIRSRVNHWGTKAVDTIATLLSQELPGLRGFSESNIKNMRIFYEKWREVFENRQPLTAEKDGSLSSEMELKINRQLSTADLSEIQAREFFSVSFTHHREILRKAESMDERWFYIHKCATEFWQVKKLQYALAENIYGKEHIALNNFTMAISDEKTQLKALETFKDNYVLDFVDIEDCGDFMDERVLETEIVKNIKNFIMAFGQDFTFMGNQYRLNVDGRDFFIDLLFYHRSLRCLIAIELKRGDFKALYTGQMNLYLSILDEYVKHPDENPSIGIILCKEKSDKIVEFAFRNISTPIGVATYTLQRELPPEYKNALPDPEDLRNLL